MKQKLLLIFVVAAIVHAAIVVYTAFTNPATLYGESSAVQPDIYELNRSIR